MTTPIKSTAHAFNSTSACTGLAFAATARAVQRLGLRFEVVAADVDERRAPRQSPQDYAIATALAKARPARAVRALSTVVIGADTDVVVATTSGGRNAADALGHAGALVAREHEVYSAVAVVCGESVPRKHALSVTRVSPRFD